MAIKIGIIGAGGMAHYHTPDQALKLMRIIDAVYGSAKSGKPVKVAG